MRHHSSTRLIGCCAFALACLLLGVAARDASASSTAPQPIRDRLLDLLTANGSTPQALAAAADEAERSPGSRTSPALRSLVASVRCRAEHRATGRPEGVPACDLAHELAQQSDDPAALFASHRNRGTRFAELQRKAEATVEFLAALSAAQRLGNDAVTATALANLGAIAHFSGAFGEAIDYYESALALAERAGAGPQQATIGSNLGYLLLDVGSPDAAIAQFDRAIAVAERVGQQQAVLTSRAGRAYADIARGRPDESAIALRRLLTDWPESADAHQKGELLTFLARAELAAGRPRAAERAARDAVTELAGLGRLRLIPAQAVLVDALAANGSVDEALALATELARTGPDRSRIGAEILEGLAAVHARRGEHRQAYEVLRQMQTLRAEQTRTDVAERLAFLRARLESESGERELQRLRTAREQVEAQANRDRLVRNFSLLIVVLAAALSIAVLRVARVRRALEIESERRQRFESVAGLTSGVAHDFNNLMTIVQQCNDLLRSDPRIRESPKALQIVDESTAAARAGGHITQQLLSFARRQQVRPIDLRVDVFLEDNRSLFEHTLGAGMTLELRVPERPVTIRVDRAQLVTALINLLANARDALGGRGSVTLRAAPLELHARTRDWPDVAPGGYVLFEVEDRGPGMDTETRRRATTPFFTTKSDSGGSGLGLSMVDGFASQSGGALAIRSEPGHGTVVALLFPEITPGGPEDVAARSTDASTGSPAGAG